MYIYLGKVQPMTNSAVEAAMKIIWENERKGEKWDDLWEYPYSDWERADILARLRKTVMELAAAFPEGIKTYG